MAMKEEANLNRRKTRGSSRDIPPSPTITLSQYWDESDEKNSSDPVIFFKCSPKINKKSSHENQDPISQKNIKPLSLEKLQFC
jgi:hypothetical protein